MLFSHDRMGMRGAALTAILMLSAACGEGGSGAGGGGSGKGGGAEGGGGGAEGGGGAGQGSMASVGAGGDPGFTFGSGGFSGTGGGQDCEPVLIATVRDFRVNHPDFENFVGRDTQIVTSELGADGKPVYAGNPRTATTSSKENFDQWFRDVPGVNMPIPVSIPLTPAGEGKFIYTNTAFFPIDEQGFGNENFLHNFHFTIEIRTQFIYEGGEVFTFEGDDDLFTYINGKLAINLGGVHFTETATVDLDAQAGELGLQRGESYSLDFFFAERHTPESNFSIETTISCFKPVPVPN